MVIENYFASYERYVIINAATERGKVSVLEQRRFRRIFYASAVQYRLSPGQEPSGSLSCDYSVGGIRLRAHNFIPLKTKLFLDFVAPKEALKQVVGQVVWVQRLPHGETYQVGVEFEPSIVESSRRESSLQFSM